MNDTRLGIGQMGIVATVIQHATNPKAYKVKKAQQAKALTALASWNARAQDAGYADAKAWLDAGPYMPTKEERATEFARLPPDLQERQRENMRWYAQANAEADARAVALAEMAEQMKAEGITEADLGVW